MSMSRGGRPGSQSRSATAVSGAAAAGRTARIWGMSAVEFARRWQDPREKALRRIRRARRRASGFGAVAGTTGAGAAGLAVVAAPDVAVVATGSVAGLLAVPAVFGFMRYRKLRSRPLPAGRAARRTLPPATSVAFEPMARLERAERALHPVLGVLARTGRIPAEDVADTDASARSAAAALTEAAADIAALEQAARLLSDDSLRHPIAASAAELSAGVAQYEEMATAAAQLATAPYGSSGFDRERGELALSAGRLIGLAAGLAEVEDITRRYR